MATEQTITQPQKRLETRLEPPARRAHRCPWWAGPLLASPIRRLLESPEKLLGPWVSPGMTVLDVGCAMGFFSLPLARMAGPGGRVLCVDVEPRMIEGLVRRATRAGLAERIVPITCGDDDLGLADREGTVDLAVAIHSLHEMPDIERALRQIAGALRPGGRLLLLEPKGHTSQETWEYELKAAGRSGLRVVGRPVLRRRRSALLEKA
jgi:ubiquinone/menaquinone biosynthesis C-methylase UbiE